MLAILGKYQNGKLGDCSILHTFAFYPPGMKPADYLSFYATKYATKCDTVGGKGVSDSGVTGHTSVCQLERRVSESHYTYLSIYRNIGIPTQPRIVYKSCVII